MPVWKEVVVPGHNYFKAATGFEATATGALVWTIATAGPSVSAYHRSGTKPSSRRATGTAGRCHGLTRSTGANRSPVDRPQHARGPHPARPPAQRRCGCRRRSRDDVCASQLPRRRRKMRHSTTNTCGGVPSLDGGTPRAGSRARPAGGRSCDCDELLIAYRARPSRGACEDARGSMSWKHLPSDDGLVPRPSPPH